MPDFSERTDKALLAILALVRDLQFVGRRSAVHPDAGLVRYDPVPDGVLRAEAIAARIVGSHPAQLAELCTRGLLEKVERKRWKGCKHLTPGGQTIECRTTFAGGRMRYDVWLVGLLVGGNPFPIEHHPDIENMSQPAYDYRITKAGLELLDKPKVGSPPASVIDAAARLLQTAIGEQATAPVPEPAANAQTPGGDAEEQSPVAARPEGESDHAVALSVKKLTAGQREAYLTHEAAKEKWLEDGKRPPKDREAYEWAQQELGDNVMIGFEAHQRQLARARRALRKPKNRSRADRDGRSIVGPTQI